MKLIQYSYASKAVRPLTDKELKDILDDAVIFNKSNDLTGFLLYNNENFIQVLEGSEDSLDAVLVRITKSSKHKDINKLYKTDIARREFSNWAMGFKNSSEPHISFRFNELLNNNNNLLKMSLAQSLLTYVARSTDTNVNENIKSILKQCNYTVDGLSDVSREEKFAQLIIKECIKLADKINPVEISDKLKDVPPKDLIVTALNTYSEKVRQHFGITQ